MFLRIVIVVTLALAGPVTAHAGSHAGVERIAVIGATARSGRVIIRQALERGYRVTGLARNPQKLALEDDRLTLVKGDVRDVDSLKAALSGDEVVICMVGFPTPKDPTQEIGEVDLYTVMAANLIEAMRQRGNNRLIIASSTGVEHRVPREAATPEGDGMSDAWRFNARYLYNDMADMEQMIADSGLEYVILRPGFMVDGPARHDLRFTTEGGTPKQRTITYEDFAAFTLDQVTGNEYLGKAVGIFSDTVMDPAAEMRKFQEQLRRQSGQQQPAN